MLFIMSSSKLCQVQVHGQEVEFIDDDLNDNAVEEAQVVDDYVVEEEKNVDMNEFDRLFTRVFIICGRLI